MKKLLVVFLALLTTVSAFSEDIELYLGDVTQRTGNRAQVLVIFDNSGSMNSFETVKKPYNPNANYPAVGGFNALSDKFIYFTKGAGIDNSILTPDSPNEQRRFLDSINSCATARERLASVGFYTGHIREYAFQGNSGSWQEIPNNNGANIDIIDCEDDINQVPKNPEVNAGVQSNNGTITPLPNGYPIDGLGTKQSPIYYINNTGNSNVIWSGEVVTLYTDNYLRWSHSSNITTVKRTRLDIAKDTVTDLIESAPSVDFGLQIFNINAFSENERDGGRVVFGIQKMTTTARQNLVDIIDLKLDGETNTPLCETLYEARRYFGGLSVDFGDNDSKPNNYAYTPNTPPRDTSIEVSKIYKTPYTSCSNEVFVILITDGTPTLDNAADNYIASLPNIGSAFNVFGQPNYLPALAGWMKNNDLNNNLPGEQTSTLFTIGFGKDAINDAGDLLRESAKQGGGKYYPANDPSSLLSSLQSIISNISKISSTFTGASVATNSFDRTKTQNSIYYAMFLPDRGSRWQGNLKRLDIDGNKQIDRANVEAIGVDGQIKSGAKTFWSNSTIADGNDVKKGGVAAMLRTKVTRTIYSDIGTKSALTLVPKCDVSVSAAAGCGIDTLFGGTTKMATAMGIAEKDINVTLNWARGIDVDDADKDGSKIDIRFDVFGDPLHSKPLVVNYGGSSASNQDVRIIVGTNAGALHMFKDISKTKVGETWAFMPKELLKNIHVLRDNFSSSSKVYGIDGSATLYKLDVKGDGAINSADSDKAWVFFGLRRGGDSYYGLDITNPDSPVLMWHIDSSTAGYSELGQTWSQPRVGYSKLNIVNGVPQPVLFFGGGYAISKDSRAIGGNDSVGRAIYMADAATGKLLWSLSPGAASAKNTYFSGTDSIPAGIGILDGDADGFIDRLYAGDTGGNVWRIDMPGSVPNSSTEPWTVFKLAQLGSDSDITADRRFFNKPSIVRAIITDIVRTKMKDSNGVLTGVEKVTKQNRPYDAILIGSGDKTNPLSNDTKDKFFMIKDENVITQSFPSTTTPVIPAPATILASGLYDYTGNPLGGLSGTALDTKLEAVTKKSGWYVDFLGSGEKSTAAAIAIENVAFFSSFQPATANNNSCTVDPVTGFLYAVNLALGTTVYHYTNQKILTTVGIIDTPQIVVTNDPLAVIVPCEGTGCTHVNAVNDTIKVLAGKILLPTGKTLNTWRTYLNITE